MAKNEIDLGALDLLISKDLNEIPDLPDYKTPPAGSYRLCFKKIGGKSIAEKTAIQVIIAVEMCHELADPETPEEDQVKATDQFSQNFFFDKPENTEQTLGALKKLFAPFSELVGSTDLKTIMSGSEGFVFDAKITNRVDKSKSPPGIYASVRDVVPVIS